MELPKNIKPYRALQALGIIFLILAIAVYQFSIKNTLHSYRSFQSNAIELEKIQEAPTQIIQLKKHLSDLESSFANFHYDRKKLFEEINTFCSARQLKIDFFYPEEKEKNNDIEILTNKLEVSGSYHDLLGLAHHLEMTKKMGHIASTEYKLIENRRTKKKSLKATFFIRHVLIKNT